MNTKTYNTLKKIFPFAFKLSSSVGQLILGLILHLFGSPIVGGVVALLMVALSGILGFILGITIILAPLAVVVGLVLGAIGGIAAFVLNAYGLAAAIIEILVFAKVIKAPEETEVVEVVEEEEVEEAAEAESEVEAE